MWNNGHDAYLESRIFSADPVELVSLLYQGCGQAVRDARHYLASGRIAERSAAITKACDILLELTSSLDVARGGEIAKRLGSLYEYMLHLMLEANIQQSDAPLAQVLELLDTVGEGWRQIRSAAPARPAVDPTPAPAAWSPAAASESYATQSWSYSA